MGVEINSLSDNALFEEKVIEWLPVSKQHCECLHSIVITGDVCIL